MHLMLQNHIINIQQKSVKETHLYSRYLAHVIRVLLLGHTRKEVSLVSLPHTTILCFRYCKDTRLIFIDFLVMLGTRGCYFSDCSVVIE